MRMTMAIWLVLGLAACSGGGGTDGRDLEAHDTGPSSSPDSVGDDSATQQVAWERLLSKVRLEAVSYAGWYTQVTLSSDAIEMVVDYRGTDYCLVDVVSAIDGPEHEGSCRQSGPSYPSHCASLTTVCTFSANRHACTCRSQGTLERLYAYPRQEWLFAGGGRDVALGAVTLDIPPVAKSLKVEYLDYVPGEAFVCDTHLVLKWIGGTGLSLLLAKQYPGRVIGIAGKQPDDWSVPFDYAAATCIDRMCENDGDGIFEYPLGPADFAQCPDLTQTVVSVRPAVARDFVLDDGPFAPGSTVRKGAAASSIIPFSCM